MKYNIYKGNKDYFPPYLSDYTEKELKRLKSLYRLFHGETYIVDPLGVDQVYAIMFDSLPFIVRKLFFKTKHVKVQR